MKAKEMEPPAGHEGHGHDIGEGAEFISCPECGGLHPRDDGCLNCGGKIFGNEKFCPHCGADQEKLKAEADGSCSQCGRELLSKTALAAGDYKCPHCHGGDAEGVEFNFNSPELYAKYDEAKKAAAAAAAAVKK